MSDLIFKTLEHAPALAAMAFIVVAFLRFQERREVSSASTQQALNTAYQMRSEDCIRTVREIASESHAMQQKATAAIEKNIEATTTNTAMLREMTTAFRQMKGNTGFNQ